MKRLLLMAIFGVEPGTTIKEKLIITVIRFILAILIMSLYLIVLVLTH